jgi:hypothetical protein
MEQIPPEPVVNLAERKADDNRGQTEQRICKQDQQSAGDAEGASSRRQATWGKPR